jgi:hypothetical protein
MMDKVAATDARWKVAATPASPDTQTVNRKDLRALVQQSDELLKFAKEVEKQAYKVLYVDTSAVRGNVESLHNRINILQDFIKHIAFD